MRTTQRGVTLIELMTVLVVVAILASIAVPSYRSYLLRAQRSEATTVLLHTQAAQEKYFVQNNAYATDLTSASPVGLGIPATTVHAYYDITLESLDGGSGYRATATARAGGGQRDDSRCVTFSIDHNGLKSASDSADADAAQDCWR